MNNKSLTIAIGILATAAVVLGYAIYQQNTATGVEDILFQNRFGARENREAGTRQESSLPQAVLPSAQELGITEEERAALDHPAKDAPQEEKQRHLELVESIAQEADALDITRCQAAAPVVLKVSSGQAITVKNADEKAHTIVFDAQTTYSIPANSTKEITPEFPFGPGTYGYGCDQVPHAVGLFLVVK